MIQRQQSLWLLLATLAALFTFMFPFVTGQALEKEMQVFRSVDASSNFLLLIVTGISIAISGATIFLYKDRKLQMKLCLLGILAAAGIIALYVVEMNKLNKATLALYCILPVLILIGYIMAYRNINKDEKLVRSLDKIR
jgi:uncharacterized membrane protein